MDLVAYKELTGYSIKSQGANWKSLCVCHSESTPSFFIHKETYLCHCFGCGAKGYLDNILAGALEMSATEVRERLNLPPLLHRPLDIKPKEEPFSKTTIAHFKRISMHPFLKRRRFKSDVVMLHSARWDPEGRIVFPVRSLGGKLQGALGRTVKNAVPKWYSYGGVPKGNVLYQAVDTLRLDIIVEGIFDVMWLNQYGYTGTAGLLTSNPTKKQIDLIKRNTNDVLLFLDNDEAGRIGQETLIGALKSSMKVTIAKYPEGKKDPQELTETELHRAIETRQTYVEYTSSKH